MSIALSNIPQGTELGYAEVSSNGTSSSQTAGNDAWTGLSITVTVGSRPIIVEAACSGALNDTGPNGGTFAIYEGATKVAATTFTSSASNEINGSLYCRARLTPSAGSHTYTVKINACNGGTAIFAAAPTSDSFWSPAWIQATEV